MSDKSKIEWTDATWNPIRGCSRVSEGCRNCYAEKVAARFNGKGLPYERLTRNGKWNGKIMVVEDALLQPLKWKRPRKIFVNSMSDLFHENVTESTIDRVFAIMALSPQHQFQVLTKRPDRMEEYFKSLTWGNSASRPNMWYRAAQKFMQIDDFPAHLDWCWTMEPIGPLPNVWLGVSVEDQKSADLRIPHLLRTPAAVRWLSCEPLLGRVDLGTAVGKNICRDCGKWIDAWTNDGFVARCPHCLEGKWGDHGLHWVVVGGESGANARPMHPDWARGLRDQCQEAGVPFFFKQWGEWMPSHDASQMKICAPEKSVYLPLTPDGDPLAYPSCMMTRVGKHTSGRVLDGRTWDEFPQ